MNNLPLSRITRAVNSHGLHTITSELLKQAGAPYPEEWSLRTAALAITLKMAENRESEKSIRAGVSSYIKAVGA
jgi:hypothetical protein